MNISLPESQAERASRLFYGTLFGLLSALGYTAANTFLRSVAQCDAIWVSAMKASPLVVLAGPWLLVQFARTRRRVLPTGRVLVTLTLAGLLGQLGGNVLFQWSLGVVGMALSVPLCLGTIILSGALLGRIFLGEPLSGSTWISIAMLVLAITVLSWGAPQAQLAVAETIPTAEPASVWHLAAGVAAAGLSGLAYSVLGVVIRYGVKGRASLPATLFIVGFVGVVSLGGLTLWRIGWEGMCATSWPNLTRMSLAGLFNAAAFVALVKALQMANVVYVNALNATQAALAAVAGVLLFQEALSAQLALGILLTMFGLIWMKQSQ